MKQRKTITLAERVKLTDLLREQYAASGLTDGEFAALIQPQFASHLNRSHIVGQREALGIPNNKPRERKPKPDEAESLALALQAIAALEQRVAALERAAASPKLL